MELLIRRPLGARAMFVMAHGAGAGMRHPFMEAMAEALYAEGIATTRFEFPYMAAGKKRIDPFPVIEATIRGAVEAARGDLPLFAGGKSFGGRMTSHVDVDVRGLIFLGFPLHPTKEPSTTRAAHLPQVRVPMLFLQGTRDALCDLRRLRPMLRKLTHAKLHVIKGADHAFNVRGRSDVVDELARTIAQFVATSDQAR